MKITQREDLLMRRALDPASTPVEAAKAAEAFVASLRKRGVNGYEFVKPRAPVGPVIQPQQQAPQKRAECRSPFLSGRLKVHLFCMISIILLFGQIFWALEVRFLGQTSLLLAYSGAFWVYVIGFRIYRSLTAKWDPISGGYEQ